MPVRTEDDGIPIGVDETATLQMLANPEIEALPSMFMMRWRRDGEAIRVRLIEQQEGAWRLLQKQKIQTYLQSLLPDCSILL
jgi:hypothetical protein